MNILITGSDGFIGKNLHFFLKEAGFESIFRVTLEDTKNDILKKVASADFIYHLAGVNRTDNESEFKKGNTDLTRLIVNHLIKLNKKTPILLTSSIQAELANAYGVSKSEAEKEIKKYNEITSASIYIYRLPNVFGKWCRPNYNSVVATFCYNILNDLPIVVHDPDTALNLVYIDDLCNEFVSLLSGVVLNKDIFDISPVYKVTVGEVSNLLLDFKKSRKNLLTENVGAHFIRALYSTYMSYLEPEQFSYCVPQHSDARGTFVEMLKTRDSGQFSYFTAHPGVTRGGHYHHTKTEKFLVIKGCALFKFQHLVTNESYELRVNGDESKIVETAPGWSHDITNIGENELIVMLWANEIFDIKKPDTVAKSL